MNKLIECVPNFSDGRNQEVIDRIIRALIRPGVTLLDRESDINHNRSVISLVASDPAPLLEGVFEGIKVASQLIDLTKHKGEHPRMGATDVVPFIPIQGVTVAECIEMANALGKRVADELGIPVYLYEDAATRPERQNLADVRKGQFEGIREEIKTNPARKPDYGPSNVHPTAGAIAIGARMILIAFNVNLGHPDVKYAKLVANSIRFKDGGLRYVKALGFELKDKNHTQVSMNMVNYVGTPLYRAFEFVRVEAMRYGISIVASEIVGITPLRAITQATAFFVRSDEIKDNQIVWDQKDMSMSIKIEVGRFTSMIGKHVVDSLTETSGGFKGVRAEAIGQEIQIHILNAQSTAFYKVFLLALFEIERFGTTIVRTSFETIPVEVLSATAEYFMRLEGFKLEQILEAKLQEKVKK
ncbi:MAG TPA: glutamate formimidoyltransferase [Candidatus Hodarchaeales archaeon]|nr:glutamate formimidoyltransferase [Candidatus Hodarchaeales archaeon]